MTDAAVLRAFRRLEANLQRARSDASLAYQVVPNSYTNGTLESVIAAQVALDVLGEAISDMIEQ